MNTISPVNLSHVRFNGNANNKNDALNNYLDNLENTTHNLNDFVDMLEENNGSKKLSKVLKSVIGVIGLASLLITTKFAANASIESIKAIGKKVANNETVMQIKNAVSKNSGKIGEWASEHIGKPVSALIKKIPGEKVQSAAEWIFASATVTSSAINKLYDKVVKEEGDSQFLIAESLPSLKNTPDESTDCNEYIVPENIQESPSEESLDSFDNFEKEDI